MKQILPLIALLTAAALAADANRLTHLDDTSPFWPTPQSAKFTTPQWIGEPGVDAVVVLAIDDMRDPAKYEAFLRPILDRLKRIDGRAPVSIMTNVVKPDDPQLATWLKEGLSLEVHTLAHPCPCLGKATFDEAQRTYHGGVDLLASVPGNKPVAFRMPCCDSMNSASPRFFSEIFSRASEKGNRLAIDSSVFTLPPGERFAKYFPTELRPPMKKTLGDYAGFIDDYPYPYVIGGAGWEFPCMVPSDWEAFNLLGPNSPVMLEDWKAGLDYVVQRQGVFTAVFHPHGWSAPEQWIEFIDHAQSKYGRRVKFLTFREALERLEKVAPIAKGARLLDVDGDGVMDVVNDARLAGARFGVVRGGAVSAITKTAAWTWKAGAWQRDDALAGEGWLRDFDRDGVCERLASDGIFTWKDERWQPADFALPPGCAPTDARGRDNGLRFVDLNGDGYDDVIQSNDAGYAVWLWAGTVKANLGWKRGWPHLVASGPAGARAKVLPFVKDGRDYGAWFHRGSIVWQNEDVRTAEAESLSRTFKEIIAFDVPPPKPPRDSLAALRPRPGFTVELVAAEPLVQDPVAFDWDAQGRLWVVEMRDYPLGIDGKGKVGGVVKILTDTDGDGRLDKADTFLDGLAYPSGLMPWRNGVLISASADIIFAADTNGDGRADERRVLFTGFTEGNQQHRQNGHEWGLDGWIYGANGDSGGTINGVSISGRDFRFRPDTGEFEPESGQTQFGRRRDDWGNWFGNNNSNWMWHYTIEDRYLRRNPKVAVIRTRQMLAEYPDAKRVFPISELPIRFNQPQSLGYLTSGCSAAPYRDELFGPAFATSAFIAEPVHNVVHREVLSAEGASFTSRRADDEQGIEFLASKDPWFRPVFLKTGPDGALYVADYYRFVLEHPEWIAPETQSRLDLRAGSDKGRIYRVFPNGAKLRPVPNLAKLDNAALAAAIDSPNGWQRDTAHRLLVERKARDAAPALRQLAAQAQNPKVRVQALAALDTLGALDAGTIRAALRDPHPGVRVQALRGSENAKPEVLADLLAMVDDPDFAVRRQAALSLGAFRDERIEPALHKLAERDGEDAAMRLAIKTSLEPRSALFAKLTLYEQRNGLQGVALNQRVALPKPSTPDRAKVIASYAGVAQLKGVAARGHELFQQQCLICHRLKGEGHDVGPDLGMVNDKPVEWLLTAIFDPSAVVEERFRAHTLKLKSGTELAGIISAETANNIVLKLPGGVEVPVLRGDIASQQPGARSLMPEGIETVLKPQDVADLIAWIRAK